MSIDAQRRQAFMVAASCLAFGAAIFFGNKYYASESHDGDICHEMKGLMNHSDCSYVNGTINITCNLIEHSLGYFIDIVNSTCANGTVLIYDAFDNVRHHIDSVDDMANKFSLLMGSAAAYITFYACLSPHIANGSCRRSPATASETIFPEIKNEEKKIEVIVENTASTMSSTSSASGVRNWMSWFYRGRSQAATERSPLVGSTLRAASSP